MSVGSRARRVTSADVAREAGLSRATVSYVLNDTPHQKIPAATRERVLAAAARLGYSPSAAARALRKGRSDVVLCLLPDWPIGPSVGALLSHLSTGLAEAGLTLLAHPRSPREIGEIWKTVSPAAVLAWEELDADEAASMRAAGVDVSVALIGTVRRRRAEFLVPQQRIGQVQAEHLAATGHRLLGYAAPGDERVAGFARSRLEGVRTGCAQFGLDEPSVLDVPLDPAEAAGAVRRWREAGVTAVCAYNDEVALAVLAGMRALGLSAPGDLAVVGVDDIPAAALADPPLTTVHTDLEVMGRYIARLIVARLAGEPAPRRPGSDTTHLVVRGSA